MTVKKCLVAIVLGVVGVSNLVFGLSAANPTQTTTPPALGNPHRILAILPALSADISADVPGKLVGVLLLGFVAWNERKRLSALLE